MWFNLLTVIPYMLVGFFLATSGVMWYHWQFWGVLICMTITGVVGVFVGKKGLA